MAPAGTKSPGALRLAASLGATALTVALVASCGDGRTSTSYRDCDQVVRRCRTVCDYWCDAWGCYPMCWDQCWDDCYRYPDRQRPGDEPPPAPPPEDAGPPVPPVDAGGPSGAGDLCAACTSNDDCASGALCILRGGPSGDDDGGAPEERAFCGQACSLSGCPDGFSCTQLGSSRQCLPTSGACR
ncbi:MAG: hypothetical protein KF850_11080 [Labilithrix sp.]|nr:hypothetical protein [Labilithrix sp.]